jgi:hypothetical protein
MRHLQAYAAGGFAYERGDPAKPPAIIPRHRRDAWLKGWADQKAFMERASHQLPPATETEVSLRSDSPESPRLCSWETALPGGRCIRCTSPPESGKPWCRQHLVLHRRGKALTNSRLTMHLGSELNRSGGPP